MTAKPSINATIVLIMKSPPIFGPRRLALAGAIVLASVRAGRHETGGQARDEAQAEHQSQNGLDHVIPPIHVRPLTLVSCCSAFRKETVAQQLPQ